MMLIVLVLSVPLGVGAAIYLEEFSPKNNRWIDIIEVNVNNLAAVPSIVFGLLGLAVFLGVMGLPRSALPVQIFLWADSPERVFTERSAAAIMVLPDFLILMNTVAVILRQWFKIKW